MTPSRWDWLVAGVAAGVLLALGVAARSCTGGRCPCDAPSCALPCTTCCPDAKPEGCVPSPTAVR